MNETESQPEQKVAPVLPKYIPVKNSNLFRNTKDGAEFYCPFCKTWRKRSEYLAKIYANNENSSWVANVITCTKIRHIGFNYRKLIKECPPERVEEISSHWSKKALGKMLNDQECLKFMRKYGIKPEDVKNTRDCGQGLTKLSDEKLKVVLKWH